MVGLFFMSQTTRFARVLAGDEDPSIHIFESEEAANEWLLEKLIAAEVVDGRGLGYWFEGLHFDTPEELLEAIRNDLEDQEFMHIYPAVDHR